MAAMRGHGQKPIKDSSLTAYRAASAQASAGQTPLVEVLAKRHHRKHHHKKQHGKKKSTGKNG